MATPLIPLDSKLHRHHGWLRYDNYLFAAKHPVAPMLLPELSAALPFFPLAFVKRPDGGFTLVALQGLHADENLYLDAKGRWQSAFMPGCYRGYPFSLQAMAGAEAARFALCIDPNSGLYREQPGAAKNETRFFDDDGQPDPLVAQVMEHLQGREAARRQTQAGVDALAAAGLIEPWPLPESLQTDPARPLLQGFCRVSEAALNALGAEQLHTLRGANALAIAYAQLFSAPRLSILHQLAQARAKQAAAAAAALPASMDSLFGNMGEVISFG